MSLTDFKAKMNKSKINKYKINNNNKANTKHEFNVKYERYKQDISKDRKGALIDIAGPAYRVTIPVVIQVAFLRAKLKYEN